VIEGLKPYPAYRDSGVPWLGEIPQRWTVERLKSRVVRINEAADGRPTDEMYIALEHVESWTGRIRESAPSETFDSHVMRFKAGDVLFGKLRPYLAKVTCPTRGGVCVGEFLVLRPRSDRLRAAFLERVLRSRPIIDAVDASTFGAKMPRADWQFVGSMALAFPPAADQDSIAEFLDYVDRRIERYAREKQRLIQLLEEQKQAIIHRAVTRGLEPAVSLKPSGVAWLDDVPEHWDMRKLRQCGVIAGGLTPSMEVRRFWDGAIPWVTPKDMKREAIGDSSVRVSDAALRETSLRLIDPPAILIVVRGMILARKVPIAWTTASVTINQDMKALIPAKGINAEFLAQLLASAQTAFAPLIDEAGHGTRRLPTERWVEITVALPPEDEQIRIVQFLNGATHDSVAAINRVVHEIGLLREYRTRIIADVVTGKLDVREAAARLPDGAEEIDARAVDDEDTAVDLDVVPEEVTA
jgi:type I restriction enzyme S subunit